MNAEKKAVLSVKNVDIHLLRHTAEAEIYKNNPFPQLDLEKVISSIAEDSDINFKKTLHLYSAEYNRLTKPTLTKIDLSKQQLAIKSDKELLDQYLKKFPSVKIDSTLMENYDTLRKHISDIYQKKHKEG